MTSETSNEIRDTTVHGSVVQARTVHLHFSPPAAESRTVAEGTSPTRLGRLSGSPSQRRPSSRRRRFVLAVVTGALVGPLSYGVLHHVGALTAEEEPGSGDCAQTSQNPDRSGLPAVLPEPETITVNVYNATSRAGLAQDTADVLHERGFVVGEVANASGSRPDETPEETALLVGTERAATSGVLAVVGAHLDGARTGDPKADGGPAEVDLVLGESFTALLSPDAASQQLTALADGASCQTG